MTRASGHITPEVQSAFRFTSRAFAALGVLLLLYALAFAWPFFMWVAHAWLFCWIMAVVIETFLLYRITDPVVVHRSMANVLSLGDENSIELHIRNQSALDVRIEVYEELPFQLQVRDFGMHLSMRNGEERLVEYRVRPTVRGSYGFGYTCVLLRTFSGLTERFIAAGAPHEIRVYPSILQMKKYELIAFARVSSTTGIKRLRRLGHSYEFEQIRPYALGDDVRSVNWKATGRRNQLMVNQYEDERSKQIYIVIDKSRNMLMPFHGLSLLDYSINTALVIANVALRKHDRAGLITFSNRMGSTIKAERGEGHLRKLLEALYREKPQDLESDYDLLYRGVKNVIHGRSLIFLYLNFESQYALDRALPVLQKINQLHELVVLIFENTELEMYAKKPAGYVSEVYAQTVAQKLMYEKKAIAQRLRKYGIQTILTKPEDLSINTVNKYLELKAKGVI